MANEIRITPSFIVSNGSLYLATTPGLKYVTQSNALVYNQVITCTTTDTALSFDTISAANYGMLYMINLDSTNYVDIGVQSGSSLIGFCRLKPGEPNGPFRVKPSITLRAQANSASCQVQFVMAAN
jgi:hypothetical protein